MLSRKALRVLEREDPFLMEEGVRKLSWKEVKEILRRKVGNFEIIETEGSDDSWDPSVILKFLDGSLLYVGNPVQESFSRFYYIIKK